MHIFCEITRHVPTLAENGVFTLQYLKRKSGALKLVHFFVGWFIIKCQKSVLFCPQPKYVVDEWRNQLREKLDGERWWTKKKPIPTLTFAFKANKIRLLIPVSCNSSKQGLLRWPLRHIKWGHPTPVSFLFTTAGLGAVSGSADLQNTKKKSGLFLN